MITGDNVRHSFALDSLAAFHRFVRCRFEAAVAAGVEGTYPNPVAHCAVCRWDEACTARRRDEDHLSLVAGMRGDQIKKLVAVGVTTVQTLGELPAGTPDVRIGAATLERLRGQARLQVAQRRSGEPSYELLLPTEPDRGLCAEDLPRAMEFLYSLNRLNVAVFRARALAVLVCSPELLAAPCRTPRQLQLVNALCRLVERAEDGIR